jgi:hypothetical protein
VNDAERRRRREWQIRARVAEIRDELTDLLCELEGPDPSPSERRRRLTIVRDELEGIATLAFLIGWGRTQSRRAAIAAAACAGAGVLITVLLGHPASAASDIRLDVRAVAPAGSIAPGPQISASARVPPKPLKARRALAPPPLLVPVRRRSPATSATPAAGPAGAPTTPVTDAPSDPSQAPAPSASPTAAPTNCLVSVTLSWPVPILTVCV